MKQTRGIAGLVALFVVGGAVGFVVTNAQSAGSQEGAEYVGPGPYDRGVWCEDGDAVRDAVFDHIEIPANRYRASDFTDLVATPRDAISHWFDRFGFPDEFNSYLGESRLERDLERHEFEARGLPLDLVADEVPYDSADPVGVVVDLVDPSRSTAEPAGWVATSRGPWGWRVTGMSFCDSLASGEHRGDRLMKEAEERERLEVEKFGEGD